MPISGRFSTTSIALPTHIDAIRPQKSWGFDVMTCGPGWMLWIIIAPTIIAMTAFSGMPSVNSGMNDVCAPALFAASGPATPWIAPLPNCDGSFASFFSMLYDANDDSIAPPPGSTPKTEPSAVPRSTAGHASLNCALVIHIPLSFVVISSRGAVDSRFITISANPNSPIATTTTPMPSDSSGMPKSKRATPELTSVPTMPSNSPTTIMAMAFSKEPCASTTAPMSPSTINEKYSAGPNFSASADSGSDTAATSTVAHVPAKKEPRAAVASAAPAWPLRAIWYPSRHVTTDDDSPGMLTRIAVVEP